MTDDQLRVMARRVLELVLEPERCSDGEMRFYPRTETTGVPCAYAIDAVVAILREEMGKAKFVADGLRHIREQMEPAELTDEEWLDLKNDDPTQTIVIDT